jgi:hypothetical protein
MIDREFLVLCFSNNFILALALLRRSTCLCFELDVRSERPSVLCTKSVIEQKKTCGSMHAKKALGNVKRSMTSYKH